MSHRLAERRSLAYHRALAARLGPDLVARARARLDLAETRGTTHPAYVAAWRALLAGPLEVLAAALARDDEPMTALRQATPFAGALAPRERWALWRAVGADEPVAEDVADDDVGHAVPSPEAALGAGLVDAAVLRARLATCAATPRVVEAALARVDATARTLAARGRSPRR